MIDEIAGFLVTMLWVPFTLINVGIGFFLFRLLDILKPYPAGWIDRNLSGGWGIVLDDVAAGIYANLILAGDSSLDVKAEIITIGNELITGVQVDTNGPYLAQRLFGQGISVQKIVSVGDGVEAIAGALKESIARADLVLITGGLGPTRDDITTEVVTKVLKKKLVFYPEALDHINKILGSYNVPTTEGQKKQAYFPEGAEIIPNPKGTAPGFLIKEGKTLLVFLPGVPRELETMVEETILPRLENEWKRETYFQSRTLRLFGISESKVDDLLKDIFENQREITLSFLPHFPEINVRITIQKKDNEEACARLAYWEKAIRERLEPYVFGTDDDTMEEVVGNLLRKAKATIAVAESCTGGSSVIVSPISPEALIMWNE